MLNQALETYLRSVEAADVTEVVLWLLGASLLIALLALRAGTARRFTAYAPTFFTSLGILGTFVGIVVGLLGFDPAQVDASIGHLLDGLKTAFITSLAGMGASIVFRVLTTTPVFRPPKVEDTEGATPEDVLVAIKEQTELLRATRDAIAGSEESSLSGQVKLMRTDMRDHARNEREERKAFAEKLWQQLQGFAEMLSKSATEQVIEALRQVIVDFNRNLTEQFGENFKALDASVQKLVVWQEQYRRQLSQLHELYNRSAQAMTRIAEASESIPQHMQALATVMERADHQLQELERHLSAFEAMRQKAVEAVPRVQAQVDEMTTDIAAAVESASDHYKKLLDVSDTYIEAQEERSQEMLATLTRAGEQVQRDSQAVQQQVAESVQEMQRRVERTVDETLAVQSRATNQAVEAMLEQMRQSVSHTGDGVNAQLDVLDRALQQELERVLNQMGQALAQITGKFTEDYTKLTAAMTQIVRHARGPQ